MAPREPHLGTLSGPPSSALLPGTVIKSSNFSTEPKTRVGKISLFALKKNKKINKSFWGNLLGDFEGDFLNDFEDDFATDFGGDFEGDFEGDF